MPRSIRKQRTGAAGRKALQVNPAGEFPIDDGREFPDHPRVGVGGIVVYDGRVLLVRRGRQPLKGKWSIPGGLVDLGEPLQAAVVREIREETGLSVDPVEVIGVFERIQRHPNASGKRVRYHYVIVDYLCSLRGSHPRGPKLPPLRPGSDITEAEWVEFEMLSLYKLSAEAQDVIQRAMEVC